MSTRWGIAKAKESDVAAAATCDVLGATTRKVNITGAFGNITSLGSTAEREKRVRVTGTGNTLVHNATTLILPGGANIAMAAGDTFDVNSDTSGNVRVRAYQRADGTPVVAVLPGANGGTGIANTGKTITLGGNVSTSGALTLSGVFSATFTFTNTTAITFPTTGTLATLAGAETLTNKAISGGTIDNAAIGATTANTIRGTTINATSSFLVNGNSLVRTSGGVLTAFSEVTSGRDWAQITSTNNTLFADTHSWRTTGNVVIGTLTSSAFNLGSGVVLQANGTQVIGARKTGWSTWTGTADRATHATYTAPTISASPTQAEVQAIANALQDLSRSHKALVDDAHATAGHGLIGT